MGFSDSIKAFIENEAKPAMDRQVERVKENAREVLAETLGEDFALVRKIYINADIGKFYDIEAPEHVIQKLRDANLVGSRPASDPPK
jgi:hypothetical protein